MNYGGIMGMMGNIAGTNVQIPNNRSYLDELRSTLGAQAAVYPDVLKYEQLFQPQFADLSLGTMSSLLFGGNGQGGMMGAYQNLLPGFNALNSGANTAARGADVADLSGYGSQLQAGYDAANPQLAALRSGLTSAANQNVALGSKMNPNDAYRVTQGVRTDWANRGLGSSMPAALSEALGLYTEGENTRTNRLNQAGTLLGQVNATQPDYMSWLTNTRQGAPQQLFNTAGGAWLGGQNLGPSLMQPESQYAADLFNQQYQAKAAAMAGTAANNAQMISALLGVGGMLGSKTMCWAAREVFGYDLGNPDCRMADGRLKWLGFRKWLLTEARFKLREWYRQHGPEWARRLRMNPAAKAVVKRWMERRLR
jgi:hypothetical protein